MFSLDARKVGTLKKTIRLAAFAGMMALTNRFASATVLQPGDTNKPVTGTFDLSQDTLIPADTKVSTGTFMRSGLNFDFTLTTKVYQNQQTGGLDFVYQLKNTSPTDGTGDTFERLTVSSFSGYNTDADYEAGTGLRFGSATLVDVPVKDVDRSNVLGSVVGFDFNSLASAGSVNPGDSTDLLFVRTNATMVIQGSASVIDSFAENAQIQAPFGAVVLPEPASLGLIAVASLGLLGRRRRRPAAK